MRHHGLEFAALFLVTDAAALLAPASVLALAGVALLDDVWVRAGQAVPQR